MDSIPPSSNCLMILDIQLQHESCPKKQTLRPNKKKAEPAPLMQKPLKYHNGGRSVFGQGSYSQTVTGAQKEMLHQFQKKNLLPYLEGSSFPSITGFGSGRGLEW